MSTRAKVAVAVVALLHVYFLVLEMFLWTTPYALETFSMSEDFAKASARLAANQGLYNGFLAAGLLWGLSLGPEGRRVVVFFLVCVIVAGIFGAATALPIILLFEAVPGAIALFLVRRDRR